MWLAFRVHKKPKTKGSGGDGGGTLTAERKQCLLLPAPLGVYLFNLDHPLLGGCKTGLPLWKIE